MVKLRIEVDFLERHITTNIIMPKNQKLGTLSLGPLKIMVLRPGSDPLGSDEPTSVKETARGVSIGLAHMFLGAINMAALIYTLMSSDAHVVLCSVAFNFFSAEGIMVTSPHNDWSANMNVKHKKWTHIILQIGALLCAGGGVALAIVQKGFAVTIHAIVGIVALALLVISMLIGPFTMRWKRLTITHIAIGIPTFIAASVSFITGSFNPSFDKNLNPLVKFVLVLLIFYCTVVVNAVPVKRCINWIKSKCNKNKPK